MSYDVSFCTENSMCKENLLKMCKKDSWQYEAIHKYGSFYDLCGWCWCEFIQEMKHDIGIIKNEFSFTITVKDLRAISTAIEAYTQTEGYKKYEMCIDLFDVDGFHVYDPDLPYVNREYEEQECWLSIQQVYDMKKALCQGGAFMEEYWNVVQNGYCGLNDLPNIVNTVFKDVPDEDIITVFESY